MLLEDTTAIVTRYATARLGVIKRLVSVRATYTDVAPVTRGEPAAARVTLQVISFRAATTVVNVAAEDVTQTASASWTVIQMVFAHWMTA